ncbi:hypothetical protein SAMN04515666_101679 [Bosea lupini]|uniref:Pyridoxamine 5'-phosphate oxidase N-terminal domain-containing protein n=1 Tax=Bosea lupini TaxID=1036779 RepID=A0A1H7HJA7_9HYPH|nr:pyridoxamine 5'-phosphate oxidase family protein [Bosea lupini]SEK50364.1 hypothetical protein SAMN04515666_101679 [Bosea lupini]
MSAISEKPDTSVDDAAQLRALVGEVHPLAQKKVLDRLDRFCRDFIALSPFLVLASADSEGRADASPRGDGPGFVQVLDERTLLIPDRRGNNRVDSLGNVLSAPGVGLVFFVPGINETLRVNGRARMTTDAALLQPLAMQDKAPKLGLIVEVDEAYFHCGKALIRSKLWAQGSQVERASFPTLGRIVAEQTRAIDAVQADATMEEGYRTRLY